MHQTKLRPLCETVFRQMEGWHEEGLEFFPPPFAPGPPKTLGACLEKLAYHNHHIWNYENYGRSNQDRLVVFGWKGCQKNNMERNLTINTVDDWMRPHYQEGAALHSETLGSILDRVTIQYLKFLHMRKKSPQLGPKILSHIEELIGCAQTLKDQILCGELRCLELPRLKDYFFEDQDQGPKSLPKTKMGAKART